MECKKRIFVVDDDRRVRVLCTSALSGKGYLVKDAADGVAALEVLTESAFDLVISDINMPGLDGLGLYRRVAEENPYFKERFLFMSGSLNDRILKELNTAGVKYIVKPFRLIDLLYSVETMLSKQPTEKRVCRRVFLETVCDILELKTGLEHSNVRLMDISQRGLRVVHGGPGLAPGSLVTVHFGLAELQDENLHAQVVWSRISDDGSAVTGLRFIQDLPPKLLGKISQRQ